MIIWSGRGWCVPLIAFACVLAAEVISEGIAGNDTYYQEHGAPMLVALILAGVAVWALAEKWKAEPTRILVDQATGEKVSLKRTDSLFFIPIWYWSFILCAVGGLVFVTEYKGAL